MKKELEVTLIFEYDTDVGTGTLIQMVKAIEDRLDNIEEGVGPLVSGIVPNIPEWDTFRHNVIYRGLR